MAFYEFLMSYDLERGMPKAGESKNARRISRTADIVSWLWICTLNVITLGEAQWVIPLLY